MHMKKLFLASIAVMAMLPVTAAAREVLQGHFGAAMLQRNPEEYLQKDFAALAETMALAAGMKLESENKNVSTGLES